MQIVGVLSFPAEALSGRVFHTGHIDAARGHAIQFLLGEVIADHSDDLYRVKERCGVSEEYRRPSQSIGGGSKRCFDRIKGNTADDEQFHAGIR